ncbi:MAG: hypothetical protein Ct9H300mP16_01910 [Pseudomonadota bacterium]|nr:MAG: hypothetical protein Ct9H300mP16_01910 [Pseudomonadota bacterium]
MGISINGKIAVVTGASRGIGEGIAQVFASEGAMVVCAARSTEDGEKVVGSINDNGGAPNFSRPTSAKRTSARRSSSTWPTPMVDWTSCATMRASIPIC